MSKAIIRVCASCEWIFRLSSPDAQEPCPKCEFGHYSAVYVYGRRAYWLERTQAPWKAKKMFTAEQKLDKEIEANNKQFHKRQAAKGLRSYRKPRCRKKARKKS